MPASIKALLNVLFHCVVHAHKGTGIDKQFGDGDRVSAPAGGKWSGNLTGDKIGILEDELRHQRKHTPLAEDQFGGHVDVKDDRYDQGPPPGSKKWFHQVALGEVDTPKKTELQAGLDAADVHYAADAIKSELLDIIEDEANVETLA